jgi:hypothetical protein
MCHSTGRSFYRNNLKFAEDMYNNKLQHILNFQANHTFGFEVIKLKPKKAKKLSKKARFGTIPSQITFEPNHVTL